MAAKDWKSNHLCCSLMGEVFAYYPEASSVVLIILVLAAGGVKQTEGGACSSILIFVLKNTLSLFRNKFLLFGNFQYQQIC